MKSYWDDLTLTQQWSRKERFNYIMEYIDSKINSNNDDVDEG